MAPRPRRYARKPRFNRRRPWMRARVGGRRRMGVSNMRTFTECLAAGPLYTNTGGVFKCRLSDIPQHSDYGALYSQFAIRKLKVVLLPRYGASEPNAALAGLTAIDIQNTRMAFAVNDSPAKQIPTSEIEVLEDNGAKVVVGHKKLTITCYPKPDLGQIDLNSAAVVATRTKKLQWLNFDNATTARNGESIQHGSISYWITGSSALAQYECYDAYYYITFSVRDPA